MTRSIRGARRGATLLAGAAAAALLLAGCGAGQIAETAGVKPAVPGVNAQTPDGLFKIRNLVVVYPDPLGYPSGGNAPVSVALHNDADRPVTVEVSTDAAESVLLVDSSATPAPEDSPTPEAPAGGPARIEIPAGGFVLLNEDAGTYLRLTGLNAALRPGQSANLTFDFGGELLSTPAPVSVPLTPAPRGSGAGEEAGAGHGG